MKDGEKSAVEETTDGKQQSNRLVIKKNQKAMLRKSQNWRDLEEATASPGPDERRRHE